MNRRSTLFSDRFLVCHDVGAKQNGIRLDAFLKDRYKKRSREQLKEAIRRGSVKILRKGREFQSVGKMKPSSQLLSGDEVQVLTVRAAEPEVSFDYKTIHEDEDLLIIDKPANLPVHPAGKFFFNTLLIHLKTNGFTQPLKADREYFLVHRIDRETSGVLVLAKKREIAAKLVEQFIERKTEKFYLAIVKGVIEKKEFTVDTPIGRSPTSRIRIQMEALPIEKGGQHAITHFEKVETKEIAGEDYTLVKCFPKTGRQHQIRIHLALNGFPIVGDKIYSLEEEQALIFYEPPRSDRLSGEIESGEETSGFPTLPPRYISPEIQERLVLKRHALHAAGISFEHPKTGSKLEFKSPLSDDLSVFFQHSGPDF